MSELEINSRNAKLVWENNPALVQLLGLSPLLAISTTLAYGIGLGIATLFVCVLACLTTSLVRAYIPHKWRLLWFMVILASYTTVLDTLAQIYFYPLYLRLGIYVPLICCNTAILLRMETVAAHSDWPSATLDAIRTGIGLLLALILVSSCREILISGSLLSNWQILLPVSGASAVFANTDAGAVFRFANTPAGAFILLGLIIASINLFSNIGRRSPKVDSELVAPAKRARVTGRLIRDEAEEQNTQ